MSKINFKTITLKGLFFLVSLFAVISLIAMITYIVLGPHKQGFVEYMVSYYKFFIEFMVLATAIGLCVGGSMYGIKKLYEKLF
jgi:hypothetical protein